MKKPPPRLSHPLIEPLETRIAPAIVSGTVNLGDLGSHGVSVHGSALGNDSFGRTVSDAGDVNGDGIHDFLIGANFAAEGGNKRGAAYLIFGTADGSALANLDLATLDGTQGFKMSGVFNGDYAGSGIAAAGDVNGDGFGDVLISTQENGAGSLRGKVYVVYGRASFADTHGRLSLAGLDGANGFKIPGLTNSGFLKSGAGVGDVNGDGFDDILLSASTSDTGTFRGAAYVIFGGKNPALKNGSFDLAALNGGNGFKVPGLADNDELGDLRSLGDINGDGFDDMIAGSEDAAAGGGRGAVYVILGAPSFAATAPGGSFALTTLNGANGFKAPGAAGDNLFSGAGAGDVNGDGFDDFIVQAYGAAAGAGKMYVVFGKSSFTATGGLFDFTTVNGTNGFQFTGLAAHEHLGRGGFGAAGDLNGDGIADVFTSATFAAGGGVDRGESYIIFGKSDFSANAGVVSLAGLNGSNGFRVQGAADMDEAPAASSGVGDVNGDGFADFLIGGLRTRTASIIFGGPSGTFVHPTYSTDHKTATWTDLDGDLVTLKVTKGALGDGNFQLLKPYPNASGAQLLSLTLDSTFDNANVSITAKRAGGGDSHVNIGFLDATGVDLGKVTISGDLGRISAGDTVADLGLKSLTMGSFGLFDGRTDNNGDWANSAIFGGMGRLKVAGDMAGLGFFVVRAGNASSGGNIAAVTIGGALVGGAGAQSGELFAEDRMGSVKVTGDVIGGKGNFSGLVEAGSIGSVTIGGQLAGGVGVNSGSLYGGTVGPVHVAGSVLGAEGESSGSIYASSHLGKVSIQRGLVGGVGQNSGTIESQSANVDGVTIGGDARSGSGVRSGAILAGAVLGPVTIGGDAIGTAETPLLIRGVGPLTGAKSTAIASLKVGGDFDHALVLAGYGAGNTALNGHAQIGAIRVGGDWIASSASAGLTTNVDALDATGVFGNGDDAFITSGAATNPASIKSVTIRGAARGTFEDGDRFAIVAEQIGSVSIGGAKLPLTKSKTKDPANDLAAIHVGATPDLAVREISRTAPQPADTGASTSAAGSRTAQPSTISLGALTEDDGFTVAGIAQNDQAGRSVSNAGDVNGDGFDDFIVSADYAGGIGAAYVVFGQAGGLSNLNLSDLNGANGFKLAGANLKDFAGGSVSAAGDVNGDGFADLIVGATGADADNSADPNNNRGAAYVIFGRSSFADVGAAGLDLSTLDGVNGFKLTGESSNDLAGKAVSGAGDVNGDGFDDVIIGATGVGNAGAAYVVFGKSHFAGGPTPGFAIGLGTLDGTDGFKLTGEHTLDQAGCSVSRAGDVNGDGFADVIVGASFNAGGGNRRGAAYVVFGRNSFTDTPAQGLSIGLGSLQGASGFKLTGAADRDYAGFSVSATGDVNGDGFADVIVGAKNAGNTGTFGTGAGAAYIVFGRNNFAGSPVDLGALGGNSGFKVSGLGTYSGVGAAVHGAGDVNGDGFADLIVGAPFADEVSANGDSGAAYVVFGKAGGFAANLLPSALDGANGFTLSGATDQNGAGLSVSAAGDINGDGFGDVIVGAFGVAHSAGAAYVVYGRPSGEFIDPTFSADHKTATWTDVDGDLVTLTVSKGALDATNFKLLAKSTDDHRAQLLRLSLGSAFEGADVSLTAKRAGGDGQVNVGEVNAVFVDLGKVTIGGDLGHINVGDGDAVAPFTSLTVGSIGVFGGRTQDTGGNLTSQIFGPAGPVTVAGDVHEALFQVASLNVDSPATLASLTIGGSLIGGKAVATGVFAADSLGVVKIGGDIRGGAGVESGYLQAKSLASLTIGGDLHGGSGDVSGAIQIIGVAGDVSIGGSQLGGSGVASGSIFVTGNLGKVSIGHDQIGGAGVASGLLFTENPGANIASVTISGDARGGDANFSGGILAGGTLGPAVVKGDVTGTHDHAYTIRGGGALTVTQSIAIASVSVGGNFDHALVLAGYGADNVPTNGHAQIGAITVSGDWLASSVTAGLLPFQNATGPQNFFGNNDDVYITGGPSGVVASIASITINGRAMGSFETGDFYGIVAEQIGSVTLGGVKLTFTPGNKTDGFFVGPTPDFVIGEVARQP